MSVAPTITVALLDDHRTVLRGLEWLINAERPAISVVGSASTIDEAYRLCAEHRPDVLVLDLDLGGDDSTSAIPTLIEYGCKAVLVLTGVRDTQRHQAAIIAGARGVIPKEADAELIVKAIRKVHTGEIWLDSVSTRTIWSVVLGRARRAPATPLDDLIASLTTRERQIIVTLYNNPSAPAIEVAALLGISGHTLRNHLTSIYDKLGVSTRLALHEFVHKHQLAP